MHYRIKLTYNDDKEVNLDLTLDQYQSFFECLNERKVFWAPESNIGFWTNLENIRYILVSGSDGQDQRISPQECAEQCSESSQEEPRD